MVDKLLVKPVGAAPVQDFEALEARLNRFIGRVFDHEKKAWVPKDEVCSIPNREEYRQAVREGHLEAMDEATAIECRVKWVSK